MRLNVLIGGKAGQGIDAISSIVSSALVGEGFYVFNYRDYPSLIEGGQNFNVISISDERIGSHKTELDCIVALDQKTIENHEEKLKDSGFLLSKEDYEIDSDFSKVANVFLGGVLFKALGLEADGIKKILKEKYEGKDILDLDLKAVDAGYEHGDEVMDVGDPKEDSLETQTGSEAIAEGAIDAGIDIYFAYPMTPATPVLHELAGKQEDEDFLVFQPENELGVVNAGMGAAHTGAKTMVGSSGGGYDLMQEGISMQGISEIPLVVYLSQRPGPGSGVPTYTTQGDLDIAVKGGHGEFPRVTIAPGDARESRRKTNEAFYFAEKFRALSVLLGDKHVAESQYTYNESTAPDKLEVEKNIADQEGGFFPNYQVTEDGNSPRSISGLTTVKSTSYEHKESGITTEDSEEVTDMIDKRKRKEKTIKQETKKFTRYKVHGDESSDNLILGWGSTKGAIKDAIEGLDVKFIQIIYLRPFPKEIKEELEEADDVLLAENNSTGLLGNLTAEKTGHMIPEDKRILKYDGRPFTSDKLRERIKEKLQEG